LSFGIHRICCALIDGNIGELTRFHETFRIYAHAVGPETVGSDAADNVRSQSTNLSKAASASGPYLLSEHEVVRLLAGTPTPRVTINIRLALNVWWRYERKRGPV
jgi:hypothetical protein